MKSFKLNILAASVLLASGAVSAQQANVTEDKNIEIFGVLGSGIVTGSGFGMAAAGTSSMSSASTFTGLSDQPHSSNRLGFRGQRKLDEDYYARYVLEANLSLRNGTIGKDSGGTAKDAGGAFFDREANFTIGKNDVGQIQLGRGRNFLYNQLDEFDSRGNWNLGGLKPIARYAGFYGGSGYSRYDNMLRISSAPFYNIRFDFAKSFGNQLATASSGVTDGKNNSTNYGIRYTDGPLDVSYSLSSLKLSSEVVNQKANVFAIKYDLMPGLTIYTGYAATKNPLAPTTYNSTAQTATTAVDGKVSAGTNWYGAKYRLTERVTLNGGLYTVLDKLTSGAQNVSMTSLGAQYAIGKNAEVFVDVIRGDRKGPGTGNTAPFTIYDRWMPDAATTSESRVNQHAVSIGGQIRF